MVLQLGNEGIRGRAMDAVNAGRSFVERYFPECSAAFLGGSVIRGEATPTSDLDIVIVTTSKDAPYRESFVEFGWPIEAFVHTKDSLKDFFASDAKRRTPSLQTMCAEGIV